MNYQRYFIVNEYKIPYYHFHFKKEFSKVIRFRKLRKQNYYFEDGTYLPQYINEETAKQFDFTSDHVVFKKVLIIIVHSFPGYPNNDLDNNFYKPFIDTVRKQKIIDDDTWDKVSLALFGRQGEISESIDMYIVPHSFALEFISSQLYFLFEGKDFNFSSVKKSEELEKRYNEESFSDYI